MEETLAGFTAAKIRSSYGGTSSYKLSANDIQASEERSVTSRESRVKHKYAVG